MKRKVLIVLSVVLIIVGVRACQYMVDNKKAPESKAVNASAKLVATKTVQNSDVATGIPISGRLNARKKVDLFSEVGGVLLATNKEFKEGVRFQKGEVMLQMENGELRMNVVAQRSALLRTLAQMLPDMRIDQPESFPKWEAFLNSIEIQKNLPELPAISGNKEKLFLSGRNILDQYYGIRSQEVRLAKYSISAPFDGILSSALIDPGTNVRIGQPLGTFIQLGDLELEAAVGIGDAARISTGQVVTLRSDDVSGEWAGTVRRISEAMDQGTQTIKAFISVEGAALKDGMYLSGSIASDTVRNAFEMPRSALLAGNKVYTVQDTLLALSEVEVMALHEKSIVVRGLPNGAKVLNEQLAGAYAGMPVVTNGQ